MTKCARKEMRAIRLSEPRWRWMEIEIWRDLKCLACSVVPGRHLLSWPRGFTYSEKTNVSKAGPLLYIFHE